MQTKISEKFTTLFGCSGDFFASAGRINLIGEHTDYNGGFVFPGAIDKGIMAEIKLNGTNKVCAYSLDLDEYVEFGLAEEDAPSQSWSRYIFGVCREIIKRGGEISGFNTVFAGDVPLGAGMSSSAALESTFAFALNHLFNLGIDKFELARIGQSTEHNYCGVKCGIMDQFASVFGKKGQLMRLDCNKRRESCERAAAAIRERHPEVEFLRDANREWLDEVKDSISEEDYMRAEYVIDEVARVLDVCDALERDDYETVGEKMYETHYGMSRLYEVSCEELDFLNNIARECGVTGSRVMGGGFGGCTINLVKNELYVPFIEKAKAAFTQRFGHEPKVYDVVISDGARKL